MPIDPFRADACAIALVASDVVVLPARVLPGRVALSYGAAIRSAFWGVLGLLVMTGLVFAAWGGNELAERAEPATLGSESEAWGAVVVAGGLVIGYALLGGAIAALVLAGVAKVLGPRTGNGSFYGASFLGFLAYGVLTVLALFAYRRGDAFLRWIYEAIGTSDWIAHLRVNLDSLSTVFWDFWPLQVAGLLACATILAVRLRGPYSGALGYAKACVVSGLIALPLCLPSVVLGLLAVRSGVLEDF